MRKRVYLIVVLLFQIAEWKACCMLITEQEGDTNKIIGYEVDPVKSNSTVANTERTIRINGLYGSPVRMWPDGPNGWPEVPYSIMMHDRSNNICPEHYVGVGNRCLYFSSVKASWSQAMENCHAMDATLANINQQNYFRKFMMEKYYVKWSELKHACIRGKKYKTMRRMDLAWCKSECEYAAKSEGCRSISYLRSARVCHFSKLMSHSNAYKEPCHYRGYEYTEILSNIGGQSFWVGDVVQDQPARMLSRQTHFRFGEKSCIEYDANDYFKEEHCNKPLKFICEPNRQWKASPVKPAIAQWESNTCITFKEVTPDYPKTFIKVVSDKGCYATSIGAPKEGQLMRISLGRRGCGLHAAIHEFGHALGYGHEHARSDFNKYLVKYNDWGEGWAPNLKQHRTRNEVPYDFMSVMHGWHGIPDRFENHRKGDFLLMPHNPYLIRFLGSFLSWRDIKAANIAYKCIDKWRQLYPAAGECFNEGYIYKDGRCNCPHGTRGDRCQDKYDDYYPPLTCGGNVTRPGIIEPKFSTTKEQCMWWIQAPTCKQVQLTVKRFQIPHCKMNQNYLEIRTSDVRMPGKLYCKTRLRRGSVLTSEDNEIFINYKGKPKRMRFQFEVKFINNPGCKRSARLWE